MSPSTTASNSEVGESSSYEHMEQVLIRVASRNSMHSHPLNDEAHLSGPPATHSTCESSNVALSVNATPKAMDPGEASHPVDVSQSGPGCATSDGAAMPTSIPASSAALSPPSQISLSTPLGATALKSLTIEPNSITSGTKDGTTTVETNPIGPPLVIMTNIPEIFSYSDAAVAAAAVATAAAASSSSTPQSTSSTGPERSTKSKGGSLRRGKWTSEEETYVARVIHDFNSGFLNAPAGTTLRSYLSDKLQCDPMRITKKFTGDSCIGKRVFHPAVRSAANGASIDKAQAELEVLEKRWRRRLEMQQRESAKKAAASAAATNVGNRGSVMVQGVPVSILGAGAQGHLPDSQIQQTAVTQAASWLDRANAILRGSEVSESGAMSMDSNASAQQYRDESTQSSADDSLENQMREVQRLIYEGPVIQQTTAGLPLLLLHSTSTGQPVQDSTADYSKTITTDSTTIDGVSEYASPSMEPADKRMKTGRPTSSGAEDAEALVGFLRSVRASAAAGQDL